MIQVAAFGWALAPLVQQADPTEGSWPAADDRPTSGKATMAGISLIAGVIGYLLARGQWVFLVEPMASRVPADKHVIFIADLWAHSASYLTGFVGGIIFVVRVWRSRRKLDPIPPSTTVQPSGDPSTRLS